MTCIAAFTTLDPNYPPYINATELKDGSVRVIVRGPAIADGVAGPGTTGEGQTVYRSPEAHIDMPLEDWHEFLREANAYAARAQKKINENQAPTPGAAA